MTEPFDWTDDEAVLFGPTRAVAAYWNSNGEVVIRQEAAPFHYDEPFVVIPRRKIGALIARLQEMEGVE